MEKMTTLQILQGIHDWVLDKIDEETANFITKTVSDLVNYYTKSETYTKAEVQQIVDAIKQFTYEVVQVLPTASASTMNKIYLVPAPKSEDKNVKEEYITIQNGSTYSWEMLGTTSIDLSNYYTKSQTDSVISSALSNTVAESGVYDVTANNNNAKFASLSALLSSQNLDTLIPSAKRKGGMSIKFVLSSDNTYVQYRYMGTAVTGSPNPFLDTANWQGVDDVPTTGSNNLVKSGGTKNILNQNLRGFMMSDTLYKSLLLDTPVDVTPSEFSNGMVVANGTVSETSDWKYADITLQDGNVYNITMWNGGNNRWYGITIYDSNDIVLFNQNKGLSGHFVFPNTATKLRVCTYNTQTGNLSITKQIVKETSSYIDSSVNKIEDTIYYSIYPNMIVPTTHYNNVGISRSGYYDDDGTFHSDNNYICKDVQLKKGCVYAFYASAYNGKPTLIGFDSNNDVLFVIKSINKSILRFSEKVTKIACCTNPSYPPKIAEAYSFENLDFALDKRFIKKTGNNIFNIAKAVSGKEFMDNVYAVVENANFNNYRIYEINNINGETKMCVSLQSYTNCKYHAINKYGELIADKVPISSNSAIDITGAEKIMLMVYAPTSSTEVMVNFGDTALPYETYYEYYDIDVSHSNVADSISDLTSLAPMISNLGVQKQTITAASLSNGNLVLTTYPNYVKKNNAVLVDAKITAFNEMVVGIGTGDLRGSQIRITPTQIFFQSGNKTSTTGSYTSVNHGLTLTTFIKVMYKVSFGRVDYIISTLGGYYKGYYEQEGLYNENYGRPFVWADENTTLTNVILGGTSDDFKHPVWVIGDSYVSIFENRWTYYPIKEWQYKNWLLQGLAGGTSSQLFADLEKSMAFGTPKYLVWCLGMNDHDTDVNTPNESWLSTIQSIIALCNQKNITLILATIPNTANIINEGKNSWIKASGYRYIDFAKSVNGETYTSGVDNWYDGYNGDGTHPSELGAKALATQFITDFPEVLQY